MDTLRASIHTSAAADAFLTVVLEPDIIVLSLRIVAPSAIEVAAHQKDGGADTGAVVEGKPLNIKYSTDHTLPATRLMT
jgi:hypothetical protein